jgi:hypothetical protein
MVRSLTDFWWLDDNERRKFAYLELCHSELKDDLTYPFKQKQTIRVTKINEYREKYGNTNIFRSLILKDSLTEEQEILGPFIIDIDNDNGENGLEATRKITQQISDYLINDYIKENDFRILFSGHKGFNIEIRPEVIGVTGSISEQILKSRKTLDVIISYLRQKNRVSEQVINFVDQLGTTIDKVYGDRFNNELKHSFIRLHNSINTWKAENNTIISREKIELPYREFQNKSLREILVLAKPNTK